MRSDTEFLNLIEWLRPWRGISIELSRNIEGGDYWSVAGSGVRAGGYSTMREALETWADTCENLKEKNKNEYS